MAAALSDQQLQAVEQQFAADPSIIQAFNAYHDWAQHRGRLQYTTKGGPPNPQQILAAHGINFPDIEDYQIQVDPQGNVHLDRQNWFQRNADWVLPVATIGGGGAIGMASGGGTAPAPELSSMTPGAEGGLAAGASGAGAGGAGAAGGATAAGTGFGAALKAALPTIIGAGANVGGAAIAAHGNTEAAKIAAEQQDRALAQAKEIYEQNVARQKPFVDLGTSSLSSLAQGLGLPAPAAAATNPAPSTGVAAGAVDASGQPLPGAATAPYVTPPTAAQQGHPAGSYDATGQPMSTLNQVGTGSTVRIQNPQTGLVHLVPAAEVPALLQAGGVRV